MDDNSESSNQHSSFNESRLEQAIIELLGSEGYPYIPGNTIERDSCEVLIKADLREFLATRYAADNITSNEIESVIRMLENLPASDLYETNKQIMSWVADGFMLRRERHNLTSGSSLKGRGENSSSPTARSEDEGKDNQNYLFIQLIDYRGLESARAELLSASSLTSSHSPKGRGDFNSDYLMAAEGSTPYGESCNLFKMVNQLEINGYEKRIPDGILYVNGLPLVVMEFKSATRIEASIHDAYVQLTTRYRRDIPELFKYNAFCVISDGVNNKMGSFFAPYEFFYSWAYSTTPHPRLSQRERSQTQYDPNFQPTSQRERGVLKESSSPAGRSGDEGVSYRANYDPNFQPTSQKGRGVLKESSSPSGRSGDEDVSYRANYNFSGLVERARELRQRQTPAEKIMWQLLRNRQFMDLKFRRQHQIGDYITDFYCHEERLVVELDGSVHQTERQVKKDHKRDAYMKSLGFTILRFKNEELFNSPETVLARISDEITNDNALHPSHLAPLPGGEGKFESPRPLEDDLSDDDGTISSSPSGRSGDEGKNEGINSLYSMIQGLFNKVTLIDVIRNFIFIPDTSQKDEKIVCRYPQYYAATKLYENILRQMRPHGDGKGGTYFGATGCGKSFTMLFLTRLLMKSIKLSSPTIVVITDRTDLDDQISGQFTSAKRYVGDEVIVSVESRQHLRELLQNRQSGGVLLTTIHKFTEDIELLTDRNNVICISDEAHRSQVNLDQKVKVTEAGVKRTFGFAKYLHDSLPNATYVGFTGTPIDATLDVFGEVVDSYTMNESVLDEITVKIVYEGRAAKVFLNNRKLEDIEEYYKQCAENGSNEQQVEASKKATTQMGSILGDSDRIKALAEDFVTHYETRVEEGSTLKGKAMFVSSSREVAYDFYKQLIALRPEWDEVKVCEEGATLSEAGKKAIKPMERVKMVMTRNQNDPKVLYDILGTKEYRKELDRQFKESKSNFKIAIVVDMWLTGFDVPFLDTIYIDKPIQRHNLIQTISRVNRKFEGKGKGLVVDYIGIKKQMNLALAQYGSGSQSNFEDVSLAVTEVRNHLDLLSRLFHKFNSKLYFQGTPLQQLECLNLAAEYVQMTEKMETRFMGFVKRLKSAYDICSGSEALMQTEKDHVHFYLAVRSIVFKLTKGNAPDTAQMNAKVREMIKDALESDGVEEIFKMGDDQGEVDIFSEDYMEKVSKIKLPHTKIKLLQQLLAKAIKDLKKVNKMKGVDFSKKFTALVEKYNERKEQDVLKSDVWEDFTNEIMDFIDAVKAEKNSFGDMGIDFEEKAFYDILMALAVKYDFTYPEDKLLNLAKEVKKVVDDKARYTDWNQKDDIKAELKFDLMILLDENGYPPIDRDEVYKEIFEQAENFKKYQGS